MKKCLTSLLIALTMLTNVVFASKPQAILGPGVGSINFRVPSHETTHRVLSADTTYILTGWYFIDPTYSITIPAGTLIRGDSASGGTLIISRGAQIFAYGNANLPIVFTSNDPVGSRAPGDWGGVIILGAAPTNQVTTKQIEGGFGSNPNDSASYGGSNPNDNSGVFQYVRIEFAGIAFSQDNEINGLTLGGVGAGTTIDHVQVSFANDDDFEFFGGTVRAKYLVSWRNLDDTYDSDFGWDGALQFCYTKRDPNIFDASASGSSNGFESDNEGSSPYASLPRTKSKLSNMTIVGPQNDTSTSVNSKYQYVAMIRRASQLSIYNSILMGYPRGIQLRDTLTQRAAISNNLEVRTTSLQSLAANLLTLSSSPSTGNISGFVIKDWFDGVSPYASTGNLGSAARNVSGMGFTSALFTLDETNNPVPGSASEAATAGTAYQGRLAGDEWFDSVGYRGAFDPNLPREQQWDYGWTNYDPENYDPEFTTTVMNYSADWNMISVPRTVGSYEKVDLFPSSASQAFSYQAGYVQKNTLKNGEGYWLKFNSATTDTISGGTMYDLTFPVTVGWNMIGSISSSVDVASITSNPPGIVTGQFFSYSAGYNPATTIEPGKAYWVKVTSSGMFTLSTSPVAGAMNKIHIVPNGEMPPAPPTRSENNESLPAVYSLEQNYPNPFNPATTINFSLQQEGLVTLTIYTVLGQEVTVLANDQLFEQGKHQFRFDASNITSGLYYYRISVKDAVSGIVTYRHARSMILVK